MKSLKAKEGSSHVYYLFLSLSNTYITDEFFKKKRKKTSNEYQAPFLTRRFVTGYADVIQDTVLFNLWLKKGLSLKLDFEINASFTDSRTTNRIKHYLENFKIFFV